MIAGSFALVTMALAASMIFYIRKNETYIETRAALMDVKSLIRVALSPLGLTIGLEVPNKKLCKDILAPVVPIGVNGTSPPNPNLPVSLNIRDPQPLSTNFLIRDGDPRDQMKYTVQLGNLKFIQSLPVQIPTHPVATNQFTADILLSGDRGRGSSPKPDAQLGFSFGARQTAERLRIIMEFDATTNALVYCSL